MQTWGRMWHAVNRQESTDAGIWGPPGSELRVARYSIIHAHKHNAAHPGPSKVSLDEAEKRGMLPTFLNTALDLVSAFEFPAETPDAPNFCQNGILVGPR